MFKFFCLIFTSIKENYYIFQKIINLKKIKPKYLFYSENQTYQKYAYLLIKTLAKKSSSKVYYVSSEFEDKILIPNVENFFIGKGLLMNIFFTFISAKNIFLTLTDLDNHTIKKNKKVDNYIYFFHAPLSTTKIYTSTAFDNYDTIFCNGDYHISEIRKRESIKKIPQKELIKTGYFYFDYLSDRINHNIKPVEILIAPSWNYKEKNFINENLEQIIQSILNKGHNVKFRPHPEHFKRSMSTINNLRNKFINEKFILDESFENIKSMETAKCLITDNSGIAIEFVLLFKKPVLYFEDVDKIHNVEFNEYSDLITMDKKVKEIFGYSFKKDNIEHLDDLISKSILEFKNRDIEIKNFINNNFYNYGTTTKMLNDLIDKGF